MAGSTSKEPLQSCRFQIKSQHAERSNLIYIYIIYIIIWLWMWPDCDVTRCNPKMPPSKSLLYSGQWPSFLILILIYYFSFRLNESWGAIKVWNHSFKKKKMLSDEQTRDTHLSGSTRWSAECRTWRSAAAAGAAEGLRAPRSPLEGQRGSAGQCNSKWKRLHLLSLP